MPLRDIDALLRDREEEDEKRRKEHEAKAAAAPVMAPAPAPYAERFAPKVAPDVRQEALKELVPQEYSGLERVTRGALGDVGELATAPLELLALPVTPLGREALGRGASYLAEDPVGAVGHVMGAAFEDYAPREGESYLDVAKRRMMDDPLITLSDIAMVGSGVGLGLKMVGAFGKLAQVSKLAEAAQLGEKVMAASTQLDPISHAIRAGQKYIGRTRYPSEMRKTEAEARMRDVAYLQREAGLSAAAEGETATRALHQKMSPEERAYFYPVVQGKVSLTPDPNDPFAMRMFEHMAEWEQIQLRMEDALHLNPELVAQDALLAETRRVEGLPEFADPAKKQAQLDKTYQDEFAKAEEQRLLRRTQPMRDAVYDAKKADWNKHVEQVRLENAMAGIVDDAHWLKPIPDNIGPGVLTADDISTYFAGQGALYVPHSAEVLTKAQTTWGGISDKLREAAPWKNNKGALQRAGALDVLSPIEPLRRAREKLKKAIDNGDTHAAALVEKEMDKLGDPMLNALLTANRNAHMRGSYVNAMEQAITMFGGEKIKQGARGFTQLVKDERIAGNAAKGIEATHQMLYPNGRYQFYTLAHDLEPLFDGFLNHADDAGVADQLANEMFEKAMSRINQTVAVRRGPAYIVPRDAAEVVHEIMFDRYKPASALMKAWDEMSDTWRFTTLPLRPAWLTNNLFGGAEFNAMKGIHPLNPAAYSAYWKAFQGLAYDHMGWFGDRGKQLSALRKLPGMGGGGFAEQAYSVSPRDIAGRLQKSRNPLIRGLGRVGELSQAINEGTDNFYRSVAGIYNLEQNFKQKFKATGNSFLKYMDVADRVDELAKMGAHRAIKEQDMLDMIKFVNETHANYKAQDRFSRRILRRVMPFQAFWRHAVKMTYEWPFKRPLEAGTIRNLAKMAQVDLADTLEQLGFDKTKIPSWMHDSIPVDIVDGENGEQLLRMLSVKGPEVTSVLSSLDPGADMVNQMDPVLKVVVETLFGVDLFRWRRVKGRLTTEMGEEFDPESGALVPSRQRKNPVDNFLRNFWPYRIGSDIAAGGRVKRDDTTLLNQLLSPETAYKRDAKTLQPRERPFNPAGLLLAPIAAQPQLVEQQSPQQARANSAGMSQILNTMWREATPERKQEIMKALDRARLKVAKKGPHVSARTPPK